MSGQLFEAAGQVYAEWPATPMDDERGYAIDIEGSGGAWSALALTDDGDLVFCFYSLSPVDVPDGDAHALARMSEFVDRVNHGLVAGTLELDHDTGEVRLRTGLELATFPAEAVTDDAFLRAVVLDLSAANIGLMDRYLPGLVAVVAGTVAVTDIVRDIEEPAPAVT